MKTSEGRKHSARPSSSRRKAAPQRNYAAAAPPEKGKTILLVSRDPELVVNMRLFLDGEAVGIRRATGLTETLDCLKALAPVLILLDLDLPEEASWEIADRVLSEESCPELLLLTERAHQFDVGVAVRAGCVLDKRAAPVEILNRISKVLTQPSSSQRERNGIQRILIQWLKPCNWTVPIASSNPFWRINE